MNTLRQILEHGVELPNETDKEKLTFAWHVNQTLCLVKSWLIERQGQFICEAKKLDTKETRQDYALADCNRT